MRQRSIASGPAGRADATTPLVTTLVALAAVLEERPTAVRVAGPVTTT